MTPTNADLYQDIIKHKENTQKQIDTYRAEFRQCVVELKTDLRDDVKEMRDDWKEQLNTGISVITSLVDAHGKSCKEQASDVKEKHYQLEAKVLRLEINNEKWSFRSKLIFGGILSVLTAALVIGIKLFIGAN